MKLFWKMFFSLIIIVTVIFSIFGGIFIKLSFDNSLSRELSRKQNENQMFVYSFEASASMLSSDTEYIQKNDIEKIIDSVKRSMGESQIGITIVNQKEKAIYKDHGTNFVSFAPVHIEPLAIYSQKIKDLKDNNFGYLIFKNNGSYYLETMSKMTIESGTYYISIVSSINEVYNDINEMMKNYRVILGIALVVTCILAYVFSKKITRPIEKLSDTVSQMAKGQYDTRAKIKTDGEVGDLVNSFNIMADRLEKNIEELEDTARRQEDFTAAFAHELKTPLTSIIGYSDMMRSMDLEKEEISEYSNYIFLQGKRLEKLSFTLMDLISLDKQKIEFNRISTEKMFNDIEKTVEQMLREHNIRFKMSVEPAVIVGNEDLLKSLFMNIIDNGRKAISGQGIIALKAIKTEKGYTVFIQDNGCGMEKSEIKKITEAFYMIDKSRARKEGGAGIGMSLCKKIVSIHNAKWSVRSKPGKGTIISIVFQEGQN